MELSPQQRKRLSYVYYGLIALGAYWLFFNYYDTGKKVPTNLHGYWLEPAAPTDVIAGPQFFIRITENQISTGKHGSTPQGIYNVQRVEKNNWGTHVITVIMGNTMNQFKIKYTESEGPRISVNERWGTDNPNKQWGGWIDGSTTYFKLRNLND